MSEAGPPPGFLVWRLSTKWRVAVDRALAPLGLTHAQYALLGTLFGMHHDGHHPSQRELADHTGLEALYVSKLARALHGAGLIDRTEHPDDTRAVQLTLTADGLATARRAVGIVRQLTDDLLAPLGGRDSVRTQTFVRDLLTLLEGDQP